jgi:hypothetical protein
MGFDVMIGKMRASASMTSVSYAAKTPATLAGVFVVPGENIAGVGWE